MNIKSTSQIIQIPLYQYLEVSTSSILQTIGGSIIASLVVCGALYFILQIQNVLLHLSTISLIVFIVLMIKYMDYLFPTTEMTLVLAYDELRLMKSDEIQAFEKKQHVVIKMIQNTNISTIQLNGTDFPKMTIAYLYNQHGYTDKKIIPIDFVIYQKEYWTLLQNQLKIQHTKS